MLASSLAGIAAGCGGDSAPVAEQAVKLDPPAAGQGFQLTESTFSVDAGREALYCLRMPIPADYGDKPVFVRGVETRLPAGTHHYFMAYNADPVTASQPCNGTSALSYIDTPGSGVPDGHTGVDGKAVFISGVGEGHFSLPDGYALYLKTGLGHMTSSHHILNATPRAESIYGLFNVLTAPLSQVPHPVNVLNCLLQDITVAPNSTADVSATCTVPWDLDMVILGSHAHQHLERFEMRIFDGKTTQPDVIYTSTQWDAPKVLPLDKPLSLKQGQGLTFTCRFKNDSDQKITFGTGAHKEMCAIMSAYAYPAARTVEVPPSLGTIIAREGDTLPLLDTSGIDGPF